jgi:hypothetical protein
VSPVSGPRQSCRPETSSARACAECRSAHALPAQASKASIAQSIARR